MPRFSWSLLAIALASPLLTFAQTPDPQIEQARQITSLPGAVTRGAAQTPASAPALETTASTDDAFGAQQILKRQEPARPFSAFAEIAAFVTNNVALVARNRERDAFLAGSAGASFTQRFSALVRFDAAVRVGAYRYDRFPELDFQSVEPSASLAFAIPKTGGAELAVRYSYTSLTTPGGDEFYNSHALALGVQKVWSLSRAQAIYGALGAQWNWSDPKSAERDEYSATAGYRVQLTRHIASDLGYRYARYIYAEGSRRDHNQTAALTLRYAPLEWFALSASGFYTFNQSNFSVFDYEAGNAGAAAQLSLRF